MLERVLLGLVAVPFLMGAAAVPAESTQVAFTFQDPEITESSGLVVAGDLAFTVNDSGDRGRVFAVDTTSGETVGVTSWSAEPRDVEALAPAGDGEVWVGDIGDNSERRDAVTVLRVPVGRGDREVDPPAYELVYPDGPHNAETLMTDPTTGRLYVATKGVLGGTLYAAPAELDADATNELEPVGPVLPIATDGAFFPDGRHVIIRNYGQAVVYDFPTLERVGDVPLPSQQQGEGLAVVGDDRLLLTTEGARTDVLSASLPAAVGAAVAGASASATPSPSQHTTRSREDRELPEAIDTSPSAWPWFLSGLIGVGVIVVLTRSLRRR